MAESFRPLAVVTGASSGIGLELAKCCARANYDLIIAADEAEITNRAALALRELGARVEAVEADLATKDGVESFYSVMPWGGPADRNLLRQCGGGFGKAYLNKDDRRGAARRGHQCQRHDPAAGQDRRRIRSAGQGRSLSPAPSPALSPELPGRVQRQQGLPGFVYLRLARGARRISGVSVTCQMPGATETEFFARADMLDTEIAQAKKDDPADVARIGFDAMMRGEGDVVSGWKNKLMSALALEPPGGSLAEAHRKQAEPGSGR